MIRNIAIFALGYCLCATAHAATAPAGSARTISTAGLTAYPVGNGAVVYTTTPTAVTSFTYNTGSATGSVSSLTVGE